MTKDRHLRGSTQKCPKCGSGKVAYDPELRHAGYGPGIAVCQNCKVLWEPFAPEQIWDTSDPLCSFKDPCNNCAFRPGSSEQKDRAEWKRMIASLKKGGGFYCHKGVPITSEAEHGFAYPREGKDASKLRPCRGYLNALGGLWKAGASA